MRQGYHLLATLAIDDVVWCTYREAESEAEALSYCLDEFPEDEGYINQWVQNIETKEILTQDILPFPV